MYYIFINGAFASSNRFNLAPTLSQLPCIFASDPDILRSVYPHLLGSCLFARVYASRIQAIIISNNLQLHHSLQKGWRLRRLVLNSLSDFRKQIFQKKAIQRPPSFIRVSSSGRIEFSNVNSQSLPDLGRLRLLNNGYRLTPSAHRSTVDISGYNSPITAPEFEESNDQESKTSRLLDDRRRVLRFDVGDDEDSFSVD